MPMSNGTEETVFWACGENAPNDREEDLSYQEVKPLGSAPCVGTLSNQLKETDTSRGRFPMPSLGGSKAVRFLPDCL